jgi:hypothetical protein
MKGWNLFFGNGAEVLVLMIYSQINDKMVNPPLVPSAATGQTDSFNPVLMMIGVFLVVFTAGFSKKLLGEMRLLRSEVSLLRSAVEKVAAQR